METCPDSWPSKNPEISVTPYTCVNWSTIRNKGTRSRPNSGSMHLLYLLGKRSRLPLTGPYQGDCLQQTLREIGEFSTLDYIIVQLPNIRQTHALPEIRRSGKREQLINRNTVNDPSIPRIKTISQHGNSIRLRVQRPLNHNRNPYQWTSTAPFVQATSIT